MRDWQLSLVYTILPCLVGAYAAAVFLTARPISASRAWSVGLLIATLLTIGATVAMRPFFGFSYPTSSMVEAYACLYFIPTIVLVAAAVGLKSRGTSRGVGVIVLVAVFLGATFAGAQASFFFVGFVNAVQ